jgi:hypothetical protein
MVSVYITKLGSMKIIKKHAGVVIYLVNHVMVETQHNVTLVKTTESSKLMIDVCVTLMVFTKITRRLVENALNFVYLVQVHSRHSVKSVNKID